MAYSNTAFSATQYADAMELESEMMGENSRSLAELNVPIVAAAAILAHQNPKITPVFSGEGKRCIAAKIVAIRSENGLAANKTIGCTVAESAALSSEVIDVDKEILVNPYRFTIYDDECNNAIDKEKKLAFGMAKAKAILEIELNKALIALASANADTPIAAWFETPGTVAADTYEITTANFTVAKVIPDMIAASAITQINKPIILNGRNLFNEHKTADFEGGGCCTSNKMLKDDEYFMYFWDLQNFDTITGGKHTIAIDFNSLVFWSSSNNMNDAPKEFVADTWSWRTVLPRLKYMANGGMQDIYVDVKMTRACVVRDGIDTIQESYELIVRGAMRANIVNSAGRKGIIKVEKVS